MAFEWSFAGIINQFKEDKDTTLSPLYRAKTSAEDFVSTFNFEKDYISLVSFGSKVDIKVPLTQDTAKLNQTIRGININGSTALYDAMIAGMRQIRKQDGTKVLVALTDGHENASNASWQDVVDYSNKHNVPVYVIGLGSVDSDTLRAMTDSTKGQFYHTENSASLHEIYAQISQSIQSFYALKYVSKNAKKAREEDIKISFDINSIYLANDPTDPDVIAYLEKQKFDQQVKYYGKITVYVLIGVGIISLLYVRRRRKKLRRLKKNDLSK